MSVLISDSPFSDIKLLSIDSAKKVTKVPRLILKIAVQVIARSVKKKANFHLN